jgi:hypothetical protein
MQADKAQIVSQGETGPVGGLSPAFERRPWGWRDGVALLVWTAAIVAGFWDVVSLRGALFYFDITEINFPYRAFLAEELRAGRFSRWCPGLYCGLPLYSESQAGYLHPLKYLLYPWLETWQAFNFDTVLSIWLTGLGTYLWLRRHVGQAGALTGASVFGLGGFTWAHLVHTSMINALASVPFVLWGLESSWSSGRWRGVVFGGLALACEIFAGHLQDAFLTSGIVGLFGLYRAATEPRLRARASALGMAALLVGLGVLFSAVQWVPSKELLDRSPRAGGLPWDKLTYASWHPELLPTLVVREAYGTRARDTDWMDGFYPYHEMDTYLGLIAMGLAVVGAVGSARRDRWSNFWVILLGTGAILMLGRFTVLFDFAHKVPVLGSSREPVRFHLWVSLGVAALAAVGVERLERPGVVSLRGGLILAGILVILSIPILGYLYAPVWTEPRRWIEPYHRDRYRWLGRELVLAMIRTGLLAMVGWWIARRAARSTAPARRAQWAALLPLVVTADLLGAHWVDVPTVDPRYWTAAPESARRLKADPDLIRVFGVADKHSGEPGYMSEPIDFLAVRDPLDWSLPPVWHVAASKGNTPMISRRLHLYSRLAENYPWRHDLESDSHIVTGRKANAGFSYLPSVPAGAAFIHRNRRALPRARLAGRPVYAEDPTQAAIALIRLGAQLRDCLVVEDPSQPLADNATVSGTARIVGDLPERVVVETEAEMPSYLVLSDTFDPGWSATIDGRPAPIRPAYLAFRAVYLPQGKHTVVFSYRPAGFVLGLGLSGCAALLGLLLWFCKPWPVPLAPDHAIVNWPQRWRTVWVLTLGVIVLLSIPIPVEVTGPDGQPLMDQDKKPVLENRWKGSFHPFTWGAGIEAMRPNRQ